METEATLALIISIPLTLAYVFLLLKNFSPFMKHLHRMSRLKERSDLISAEAEVVDIEQRDLNGLKTDINQLYVMRVKYHTENTARGEEHSDIIFAKKPPERTGQKIKVLYSREDPGAVMTPDSRETTGSVMMFIKILLSIVIAFGVIFAMTYCLGTLGLLDD